MAVVRTATEDGVCRRGVVARAEEHLAGEREPRGGVEMTSLAKQGRRRAGQERSGWQQAHGEAATERLGGAWGSSGQRPPLRAPSEDEGVKDNNGRVSGNVKECYFSVRFASFDGVLRGEGI